MTTSPQPEAALERTLAAIVADARAQVAAGREPNAEGLETRIVAAGRLARSAGADPLQVGRAQAAARRRLRTVASVHRARTLVTRDPAPPTPPAATSPPPTRRPAALRAKPTVTGTLGVRRGEGDGYRLVWDAVPAVTEWEVRFSERPDVRASWVESETFVLDGAATGVDLPLGDALLRVAVVGRGRSGRLQRRALVSGLTRDGWRDRWQRRASAS